MSEGFQQAQRAMYAQQAKEADIIITTALIPGKPAPKLITAEMVQSMKPGSVIVDMAGEQGGNCELTVPGEAVVRHGVTIVGYGSRVAPGTTVVDAVCDQPAARGRGAVQGQGRHDQRRFQRRRDPWPHGRQGRQRHVAAAADPAAGRRPKPATPPVAATASKGHGHGSGAPMSAKSLAITFAVGALLFLLVGQFAPGSSRTSRCSCWPASSATW